VIARLALLAASLELERGPKPAGMRGNRGSAERRLRRRAMKLALHRRSARRIQDYKDTTYAMMREAAARATNPLHDAAG
jgi:hypothetical protein